ncbi:hypothetical protein [Listeria fleischmannii]|uniref:Phage gp6-like head-tail connector protein n=1 Tax=Listeria fleischmannii FSL S10-1203 TaxID=1265822 RepID=W7E027_9LIST|nr:hypothetical protein [Listeria fleischmannii]EUJ59551.1 hypothetical protein MCOL2_05605 [Listeria fleischmannii FSL S10-1203]
MLNISEVITNELLQEFKERNRISHTVEDEAIRKELFLSFEALKSRFGDFDLMTFARGRELVFERTRYVRHEALEYFEANFQSLLLEVSLENYTLDEGEDENATI